MADRSVLHWEHHHVEADTVDEIFSQAKQLYDELMAKGGAVTGITIRTRPPEADIQYRVESDDQLARRVG